MNEIIKNTDYRKWISELKQQIRCSQIKATMTPAITVAVSNARHPALDAGSSEKLTLYFRMLPVKSGQARNDGIDETQKRIAGQARNDGQRRECTISRNN